MLGNVRRTAIRMPGDGSCGIHLPPDQPGLSKAFPRYRRASGAAYDAARAYRGGGSAPGRFAVGIHGAPL